MNESINDFPSVVKNCIVIVQKSALNELIKNLLCPNCLRLSVKFDVDMSKSFGFAITGNLTCKKCSSLHEENFLCKLMQSDVGESGTRKPLNQSHAVIALEE